MDLATQSPTTEGRFGFMFKNQPPHPASGTLLEDLGLIMEEQPLVSGTVTKDRQRPLSTRTPTRPSRRGSPSSASSSTTTSPSTPQPLDQQQADPNATTNFRTPRYDLDAIYGLGPNQNPQLYDPTDRDKFKIVETKYDETNGTQGARSSGPRWYLLSQAAPDGLRRAPRRRPPARPPSPTPATTRR